MLVCSCPQGAEEGITSSGTGVADGCTPSPWVPGMKPRFSGRATRASNG